MASLLLGITLAVLSSRHGRVELGEAGSGIVVGMGLVGIAHLVDGLWIHRRAFDQTDPDAIAEAYTTWLKIRFAIGTGVTLLLESTALLLGWWELALVSGAPLSIGAAMAAPTSARIARAQAVFAAEGSLG